MTAALGHQELFLCPLDLAKKDVGWVKKNAKVKAEVVREVEDLRMPTVSSFLFLKSTPFAEPYLSWVNNVYHRNLLTRFRMNLLQQLLSTEPKWTKLSELGQCDCSLKGKQDLLYFVMF